MYMHFHSLHASCVHVKSRQICSCCARLTSSAHVQQWKKLFSGSLILSRRHQLFQVHKIGHWTRSLRLFQIFWFCSHCWLNREFCNLRNLNNVSNKNSLSHQKNWQFQKKIWNASRFCVSSLRRGHANLLCIVPILVYVLPKLAQSNLIWLAYIQNRRDKQNNSFTILAPTFSISRSLYFAGKL